MVHSRVNYEMTEEDLKKLLEACRPIVAFPQENANRAWNALGEKMGFDSWTVRPIPGKGDRFFSAIPNETENQKVGGR